MKKFLILTSVLALTACDSKPDYIIDQTAFCTPQENEVYVCKDKDGNNITGSAYEETEERTFRLTYVDGKLNGKQKSFYKSGKKAGTDNYEAGVLSGPAIDYYENGKEKFTGTYVNGKREGIIKHFYENGNLKDELTYSDDKKLGLQKYYYESGTIKEQQTIEADGSTNNLMKYDENGVLKSTTEHFNANDHVDGWSRVFFPNGKTHIEAFYKDGKKDGAVLTYDSNGRVVIDATYQDDKFVNAFKPVYDDDGNLLYKSIIDENDKELGVLYQDKKITRAQLDKELNLMDCEQAVQKSIDKMKSITKDDVRTFRSSVTPNKDGLLQINSRMVVVDFANNGVFIAKSGDYGNNRVFVYTDDTDYSTNETFRPGEFLYERAGNYKYTTILGDTRSVPAYRATSYRYSSVNPKFYLKNKKLSCCQHTAEKTTGFGEIGVSYGSFYTSDVPSTNVNSGEGCRTRNHPNYGGFQVTIFTGTDMF